MSTEKSKVGHVTAPMNIHHYENLWSYASRGCRWSWHPILRAFCAQWTISGWSKCDGGSKAVGGCALLPLTSGVSHPIEQVPYGGLCITLNSNNILCFAALCQSWTSCVAILLLGSVTLLVYPLSIPYRIRLYGRFGPYRLPSVTVRARRNIYGYGIPVTIGLPYMYGAHP